MWISRAHYGLLTEHVAEARADFDERAKQSAATIALQQAHIQVMEAERRELVRLLLVREERRTAAPLTVPDLSPPESWDAIMRKEIEEQDAVEHHN